MIQHKTPSVARAFAHAMWALSAMLAAPMTGLAQTMLADHSAHSDHPATVSVDNSLADQVAELQAKVAKLQAALQQKQMPMPAAPAGMKPMTDKGQGAGGSMPRGGMGMMDDAMGSTKPMPKGMADMDQTMMGMMGMAPGGGTGGMAMPTALPGFPGASHLYHIGSTGFFLDHSDHIALTVNQQSALNVVKEKALLDKASSERQIEGGEQELWVLTASDQPDASAIETLRGEQRLNFIRTRVPVASLFDHLETGYTIDYFLSQFPSVTRERAIALLEEAKARTEDARLVKT